MEGRDGARKRFLGRAAETMKNAAVIPFLVGIVFLSTWVLGLFFVIDMILAVTVGFEGSIGWMVESIGFVGLGTTFVLFALSTFIEEVLVKGNRLTVSEASGFLIFGGLGLFCIVLGIRDLVDSIL